MIQNSKMTRTKKTLGKNWTRYHNYYRMNYILKRACSKKLHWGRETIREYTVNHAPEVNHQHAMQYVNNPPLCQIMMMTTGSSAIQNYQVVAWPRVSSYNRRLRRRRRVKSKAVGRHCQLLSRARENLIDTSQAQWPYERSGTIKSRPSCSSGSCRFNDW